MTRERDLSPLDWPHFTQEDIAAAGATLRSGRVNQWTGEQVAEFEAEFARYCGVRHGVCVANGTLALELALHSLDLPSNGEVVVTPRTHFSSVSSIVRAGLRPVFADVDPVSQNVTAATLKAAMTERTVALLVVHLGGWPASMDDIATLGAATGMKLIEDCSQAHGARLHGRSVGSWGDVATFSFCHEKIMTTGGEGGIVLTSLDTVRDKAWSYRDHGKNRARALAAHDGSAFRWLHDEFGSNLRLSEMAASIGRSQLQRLDTMVNKRRSLAATLTRALSSTPAVVLPVAPVGVEHAYYRYYVLLDSSLLGAGWNRDRILTQLNQRGVQAGAGSCPEVYNEQAFVRAGLQPATCLPVAAKLGVTSIALHLHSQMDAEDMEIWAGHIDQIMRTAAGSVSKSRAGVRHARDCQTGAKPL